jgi:predicted nucleotidyltransferase
VVEKRVAKVVKFLGEKLKEKISVSRIVLFGSHCRGSASEESDIDVVVISEDFRGKDIFERAELVKHAEAATIGEFMVPLDVITMTSEEFESETSIVASYAKNGGVMYST